MRVFLPALVLAFVLTLPALAFGQSSEEPRGGMATSINQSGGVTAYSIGQVIQQAAPTDLVADKLASALRNFRNSTMKEIRNSFELPFYKVLVDFPKDPTVPENTDITYQIFVSEDLDGFGDIYEPVCKAAEGPAVGGAAVYLTATSGTAKATVRALTEADMALLQPICDSLSKPLSFLRPEKGQKLLSSPNGLTVFDFLSRDTGNMVLMLIPGTLQGREMEALMARYYWVTALALRYSRLPSANEYADNPDTYAELSEMDNGGTATLQIPMIGRYYTNDGVEAYPAEAFREFGARINQLDANWLKYLSSAAITVEGEKKSLIVNGKSNRVLNRFGISDLSGPKFWMRLNDQAIALEMISCIAGRFLEDNYRVNAEEIDLGRCAAKETSWQ